MRIWGIFVIFPCLAAATVAERQHVGQFQAWGAFTETAPRKCFAAAEPAGRQGSGGAAFVSFLPAAGNRARPSFRLRADPRPGSAILLTIGGRQFQLKARGREAFPRPEAEAAVVAAMRGSTALSVAARSLRGNRIRDDYPLTGFPSAVDAAALACAGRS